MGCSQICTQNVPICTKKIPTKSINTGFVGIYLFIQTLLCKVVFMYLEMLSLPKQFIYVLLSISFLLFSFFLLSFYCHPNLTLLSQQPPVQLVVCYKPSKGLCYCSPQRAVPQAFLLVRYKAVLLESSFLNSSACSFIYFCTASSVILPIVST